MDTRTILFEDGADRRSDRRPCSYRYSYYAVFCTEVSALLQYEVCVRDDDGDDMSERVKSNRAIRSQTAR